jgi:hypothetical protein
MISKSQIITNKSKAIFTTNNKKGTERGFKRINLIKRDLTNQLGFRTGKWDTHEHKQFLKACLIHRNNWARVT